MHRAGVYLNISRDSANEGPPLAYLWLSYAPPIAVFLNNSHTLFKIFQIRFQQSQRRL